jgi:hypothetical protein
VSQLGEQARGPALPVASRGLEDGDIPHRLCGSSRSNHDYVDSVPMLSYPSGTLRQLSDHPATISRAGPPFVSGLPDVVVKVSVVLTRSGRTQAEGSTAAIGRPRSMHPSTATSADDHVAGLHGVRVAHRARSNHERRDWSLRLGRLDSDLRTLVWLNRYSYIAIGAKLVGNEPVTLTRQTSLGPGEKAHSVSSLGGRQDPLGSPRTTEKRVMS